MPKRVQTRISSIDKFPFLEKMPGFQVPVLIPALHAKFHQADPAQGKGEVYLDGQLGKAVRLAVFQPLQQGNPIQAA